MCPQIPLVLLLLSLQAACGHAWGLLLSTAEVRGCSTPELAAFWFSVGAGLGVQGQPGLLPWQLCLPLGGCG